MELNSTEDRIKLRDLINAEMEAAKAAYDKKRQNDHFVQVYEKAFCKLQWLIAENRSAAILYMYLAENIDTNGALVASQKALIELTGLSRTSLYRAIKLLEEIGSLVRIKVGRMTVYALDPAEVWRSFNSAKEGAVFYTKRIAKKGDPEGLVLRKIKVLDVEGS